MVSEESSINSRTLMDRTSVPLWFSLQKCKHTASFFFFLILKKCKSNLWISEFSCFTHILLPACFAGNQVHEIKLLLLHDMLRFCIARSCLYLCKRNDLFYQVGTKLALYVGAGFAAEGVLLKKSLVRVSLVQWVKFALGSKR